MFDLSDEGDETLTGKERHSLDFLLDNEAGRREQNNGKRIGKARMRRQC